MTATATATPTTQVPRRRASRWLAALLLPIGPLAIGVLRYVVPHDAGDDAATVVRQVAANQDTQSLVVWLGFLGVFTLVPAVFWVSRLTRDAAPRTTAAALLLLVPGYLALSLLVSGDAGVLYGVREGLDPSVSAGLYDSVHPTSGIAAAIFVLGHLIGTVLLGIALWHSRAVPRWAAVLVAVSQPLHFVGAMVLVSHPLDLVAWVLNAVGFAAAGVAILRLPDVRW